MPSIIQPPRSPLVDGRGRISAEWYRFFSHLTTQVNDNETRVRSIESWSIPDAVESVVSEWPDYVPDSPRDDDDVSPRIEALENAVLSMDEEIESRFAELLAIREQIEMAYRDFLIEVQKGNIVGHTMVHKFGRNDAVPNGTWEFVNLLGFTAWPLSAATTVRIKAGGNAADDASGAGAREVTVQGIDSNGDEVSEAIATAGASASSATTTSFWRIHRAWVSSAGAYGAANTAAIVIENGSGGTDLIEIATEEGQTQFAAFTIPSGKTGYLLSLHMGVDASKSADFRVFTRANITDTTAPVSPKRLKLFFDGVLGQMRYAPRGPELKIPALSDIWVEARGSGAATEVTADFELLLVDD